MYVLLLVQTFRPCDSQICLWNIIKKSPFSAPTHIQGWVGTLSSYRCTTARRWQKAGWWASPTCFQLVKKTHTYNMSYSRLVSHLYVYMIEFEKGSSFFFPLFCVVKLSPKRDVRGVRELPLLCQVQQYVMHAYHIIHMHTYGTCMILACCLSYYPRACIDGWLSMMHSIVVYMPPSIYGKVLPHDSGSGHASQPYCCLYIHTIWYMYVCVNILSYHTSFTSTCHTYIWYMVWYDRLILFPDGAMACIVHDLTDISTHELLGEVWRWQTWRTNSLGAMYYDMYDVSVGQLGMLLPWCQKTSVGWLMRYCCCCTAAGYTKNTKTPKNRKHDTCNQLVCRSTHNVSSVYSVLCRWCGAVIYRSRRSLVHPTYAYSTTAVIQQYMLLVSVHALGPSFGLFVVPYVGGVTARSYRVSNIDRANPHDIYVVCFTTPAVHHSSWWKLSFVFMIHTYICMYIVVICTT